MIVIYLLTIYLKYQQCSVFILFSFLGMSVNMLLRKSTMYQNENDICVFPTGVVVNIFFFWALVTLSMTVTTVDEYFF